MTLDCAFLMVMTTAAMVVYQFGISILWLADLLGMLRIWLDYVGRCPSALILTTSR